MCLGPAENQQKAQTGGMQKGELPPGMGCAGFAAQEGAGWRCWF